MRPVILLDIDGVVANFIAGCLPYVFAITGREHQHDDIDQFMIEKALGLDEEQTKRLYEHVCREGWCRSLPVYEGAKEAIAALGEFADIVPVTAPFWTSKHWVLERYEWILEHLGIPQARVMQGHEKFRVHGDMLVDDRTSHLVAWAQYWHARMGRGAGVAVRFRRRYNENESWRKPPGSTKYQHADWGVTVDDWAHLIRFARMHFGLDSSTR
jgi:5'(3')-deoxyribonucleotidase